MSHSESRELGSEDANWIGLTQDRVQVWAFAFLLWICQTFSWSVNWLLRDRLV